MELKLTEKQVNALIKAYDNILLFENIEITKALTEHLQNFNKYNKNFDNNTVIEEIKKGEIEAQDLFYWEKTPEYFAIMKTISNKFKNNEFIFNEQEMYNIRNVTDLYSKMGQGQINSIRELYSNIKNVHIGGFVSFTNIFDKANKMFEIIPIKKVKEEYKINYDIHQVVRNYLAWQRKPEGGSHSDFKPPVKYSKEPLPYIHQEQEEIKNTKKRKLKP